MEAFPFRLLPTEDPAFTCARQCTALPTARDGRARHSPLLDSPTLPGSASPVTQSHLHRDVHSVSAPKVLVGPPRALPCPLKGVCVPGSTRWPSPRLPAELSGVHFSAALRSGSHGRMTVPSTPSLRYNPRRRAWPPGCRGMGRGALAPVQAPEAQGPQGGHGGTEESLSSASQVAFRYTQPRTAGDGKICAHEN